MARKSLDSRLDRLMDKLLPRGSRERAEHMLPSDLRGALQTHHAEVERIIRGQENSEPGSWYASYVAGDPAATLPAMPAVLRDALGLVDPPSITEQTSPREASEFYHRFAYGEDDQ